MSFDLFLEYSHGELKTTDIAFLGLKKRAWDFTRGMRTERQYLYDDDSLAVSDTYTYTLSADQKSILGYSRILRWYDRSGAMRLEQDVTPELNIKNLKSINRDIRQGRIDYMIAAAEELATIAPTLPEPFQSDFIRASNSIDVILKQYEAEITHYVDLGTDEFENAIANESNAIMVELLGLMVRPPDVLFPTGLTIKQSILHQLTGAY